MLVGIVVLLVAFYLRSGGIAIDENSRVQNAAGQDIAHDVMFAFAFHAFWPNGDWMLGN